MNSVKKIQIETQKQKAIKLLAEGKHSEAFINLKSILQKGQIDIEVITALAHCYSAFGQPREALFFLEKALKVDPDYLHARFLKGCVLGDLGKYREGITMIENVIKDSLDNFETQGNLGLLYQSNENFSEAITAYNKALSFTDVVNPRILEINLANCYSEIGQFTEAMKIYDKLILEDNQDIKALYNKSVASEEMGNSVESLKLLKQVVDIDPDFTKAWDELADLYEKIGAPDAAKECRTKAEDIRSRE